MKYFYKFCENKLDAIQWIRENIGEPRLRNDFLKGGNLIYPLEKPGDYNFDYNYDIPALAIMSVVYSQQSRIKILFKDHLDRCFSQLTHISCLPFDGNLVSEEEVEHPKWISLNNFKYLRYGKNGYKSWIYVVDEKNGLFSSKLHIFHPSLIEKDLFSSLFWLRFKEGKRVMKEDLENLQVKIDQALESF